MTPEQPVKIQLFQLLTGLILTLTEKRASLPAKPVALAHDE